MPSDVAPLKYEPFLESALQSIEDRLAGDYGISRRSVALLLLEEDPEIENLVKKHEGDRYRDIREIVSRTGSHYSQPLSYIISLQRQEAANRILSGAVTSRQAARNGFADSLSHAMMNPWTGALILIVVLYVGLYQFVGVFGAGVLVDFIESTVFGQWLNPWVTDFITGIIPVKIVQDLFVGEYGLITLGISYAIAIILPIVGTFFIVFSIIEDSGYLPRLAMLIDRVFKTIGLSGRAVIPMVLGFGCDTMATVVTRTQETKRERIITTLLLALAIPCSAQLGVIFGILSGNGAALAIWVGVIFIVLLLIGFLASKVIPGERTSFYIEVPPLRLPRLSNILVKTYTRLQWYFVEVLPFFLIASFLLWLGDLTGVFQVILGWMEALVRLIGLPQESAIAFLYGFFRRDFGAAGLYDLHSSGLLTGVPLLVSAVTLTLFVPCIAQFMVMLKERGIVTAVAIALFIFPFAFLVGFILNWLLTALGVTL